jgi:hypothetical protein
LAVAVSGEHDSRRSGERKWRPRYHHLRLQSGDCARSEIRGRAYYDRVIADFNQAITLAPKDAFVTATAVAGSIANL